MLAPGGPPADADHVAVEFQLPDATENLSAAKRGRAVRNRNAASVKIFPVCFMVIMLIRFKAATVLLSAYFIPAPVQSQQRSQAPHLMGRSK